MLPAVVGLIICTCTLPVQAESDTHNKNCPNSNQSVTFKPQTIFDESEEGTIFLHRWANALHIKTKTITIKNEAAFFLKKCNKNLDDLAELERHLRKQKYIREAKVTADDNLEHITVTTWDNWSLTPTISFSRKGGKNTYSFGIKERNLLGLGIEAEIESYSNTQRSGYKLASTIPLFQKQNTQLKLRFANNDDGTQQSLFVNKHFAGFHTNYAYSIGFNEESREDTLFQNTDDQYNFNHEISYKNLTYAWLDHNFKRHVLRYSAGVTENKHTFNIINNDSISILPKNRDFLYPWLGVEYLEKNFQKLTNIHLITQIEDFNIGWHIKSRLGVGNGNKKDAAWVLWQAEINKGFELSNDALLLMQLNLAGDIYQDDNNRIITTISTEYFYHFSDKWGFYFGNKNTFSDNQYLDRPVTMGGNTGLRGFPLQYQHGSNSIKFTSEIRYYPQINVFKLFDIAGAAFIDSGRAFGDHSETNTEKSWLYSAGIGARIYSPHTGGNHHVVHIDFAFPVSDNPNVDNFEIRLQAKQSF